jgi:hypothetical protein
MNTRLAQCLLLMLGASAGPAHASDPASWIHGGVGVAWREPSNDPPFDQLRLDYDTGTVLHAEVASHYDTGLLLRLNYAYTLYDALTGAGGLVIDKDIEQHDARAALFFAPRGGGTLGWRIGGGYVYAAEDFDAPGSGGERRQDGGFVEAGLALQAGRAWRFDLALAGLKVEGEGDYDAEGAEARAAAIVDTGPLELSLQLRYLDLQRESPFDETVLDLRLGIGGRWGYPENR